MRRDRGVLARLMLTGRLRSGLTQEELAERAGVSIRTVRNLEGGQVLRPRAHTVRLLAGAMDAGDEETARMIAAACPELDTAAPVPAQLPMDVAGFTGRGAALLALTALLDRAAADPTAVAVAAISGTAGVGKTALAVHWAHRVRDRFPDGQLYVDLRGYDPRQPMAVGDALAGFLTALGVSGPDIPLDVQQRAARYRTAIAGRRVLVVLDNASSIEQVRPLLPGTASCAVVVTSRDSLAGLVALHGAYRVDLDLLPQPEAVALLRRLVGDRVGAEPQAAAALAAECARLPLALRVAAELAAARPDTFLADLVTDLADQQRRLDLLDAGGDPRGAVGTVFSWSLRQLPPAAARTFSLLGLHPGPDFDAHAAAALAGTEPPAAREALEALDRAHLVQATGPGRYGMHDLLRAYAASRAGSSTAEPHEAVGRLFDYYLAAASAARDAMHPAEARRPAGTAPRATPLPVPTGPAAARTWLDTELPALKAAVARAATQGWPTHAVRLSAVLFRYLDAGHHLDALAIHGYARQAAHGTGDRRGEAHALRGRGNALYRLGRYASAAGQFHRALAVFREIGDHEGEAAALNGLGFLEERQGDYRSAAERHEQALALFRRLGDRTGEANALNLLGIVAERRGRYADAITHHERALRLARHAGDRLAQAHALNDLGSVEGLQGRDGAAARHLQQALDLFRRLGDRTGEAWTLNNMGVLHTRRARPDLATAHHRSALAVTRDALDRAGEAWTRNGLGEAAQASSRYTDAIAHHTAALAADHIALDQRARAHAGLGHAYRALGDPDRAHEHYRTAEAAYRRLGMPVATELRADLAALTTGRATGRRG